MPERTIKSVRKQFSTRTFVSKREHVSNDEVPELMWTEPCIVKNEKGITVGARSGALTVGSVVEHF
jgi:hypothetical protein